MAEPKLVRVHRLDSIRLDQNDSTYFTKEGYLVDHPILTSCGIFEYKNEDGSSRKELRLPKYVFDPKSLESYKGKPIILTHDAGEIDKNNVKREEIGTILSNGYQDGDDVRAEIIIHDTDAMRQSGLKELSLGYTLDLIEEPGVWNGQKYDAIQTNIAVNHLALVRSARAGEQARLNIDGSDDPVLKGGKMTRKDGLTPDQIKEAIEQYKEKLAAAGGDANAEPIAPAADTDSGEPDKTEDNPIPAPAPAPATTPQDVLNTVKQDRESRDSDVADIDSAKNIISAQNDDIDKLIACLETVLSSQNNDADDDEDKNPPQAPIPVPEEQGDGDCKKDGADNMSNAMNNDSSDIENIVSQKLRIARIGDKLNMDGLEALPIMEGKKRIIRKINPRMNLDGKNSTYIDVAFDLALGEINKPKDANYQRQQMASATTASRRADGMCGSRAMEARKQMIARENNNDGGNK